MVIFTFKLKLEDNKLCILKRQMLGKDGDLKQLAIKKNLFKRIPLTKKKE